MIVHNLVPSSTRARFPVRFFAVHGPFPLALVANTSRLPFHGYYFTAPLALRLLLIFSGIPHGCSWICYGTHGRNVRVMGRGIRGVRGERREQECAARSAVITNALHAPLSLSSFIAAPLAASPFLSRFLFHRIFVLRSTLSLSAANLRSRTCVIARHPLIRIYRALSEIRTGCTDGFCLQTIEIHGVWPIDTSNAFQTIPDERYEKRIWSSIFVLSSVFEKIEFIFISCSVTST